MARTYDHTRPDAEELYGRAIDSKHLRVDVEGVADVDQLIASGWLKDSLGTKLWRLRREWDLVRADVQRAQAAQSSALAVAARLKARGRQMLPAQADDAARRARAEAAAAAIATLTEAERAALQARALAMVMLKTLRPARLAVEAFSLGLAARAGFDRQPVHVLAVAGKALELYVDPHCGHCNGLGLVVVDGGPPAICPVCNGSRRRALRLGPDEPSEQFGRRLGAELERKTDYVAGRIRHFRFTRTKTAHGGAAASLELQQRLQQLRSSQAQED